MFAFPSPPRRSTYWVIVALCLAGLVMCVVILAGNPAVSAWPNPTALAEGGSCQHGQFVPPQVVVTNQETGNKDHPAVVVGVSVLPVVPFSVTYPFGGTSIPNDGSSFAIVHLTVPSTFHGDLSVSGSMIWPGGDSTPHPWSTWVSVSGCSNPTSTTTTVRPTTTTTQAPATTERPTTTTTQPKTTTTVRPTTTVAPTTRPSTTVAPSTSTTAAPTTVPTTVPTTLAPSTTAGSATTVPGALPAITKPPTPAPTTAPPTSAAPAPAALPTTGSESGRLAALGGLLVLTGAGVMVLRRRRA